MAGERRGVLVTGAGRRLGRAIADRLGAAGFHVVVHHHASADGAEETAATIRAAGGAASVLRADLRDPAAIEPLVAAAEAASGGLHALVNSAAVMERTPVGEVDAATWDALFALNLRAPFLLAQAAHPLLRRRRGTIVNVADIAAWETWPGYVPYALTKSGIVHLTRSLARVFAPQVRVNAVAPGAIELPDDWDEAAAARLATTTPMGRLGEPADVASAVEWLMNAPYVTGQTIAVDGGRRVRT